MLWQFEQSGEMDDTEVELISSFFSAVQSFVQELLKHESRGVESIDLGNKIVQVTHLDKIDAELVSLGDIVNKKPMKKFHDAFSAMLDNHEDLFAKDKWDSDITKFRVLDSEVTQILEAFPELNSKRTSSNLEIDLLKSIWSKGPAISAEQIEQFQEEKYRIQEAIRTSDNLPEKDETLSKNAFDSGKIKRFDIIPANFKGSKKDVCRF